jgi:nitroreductase
MNHEKLELEETVMHRRKFLKIAGSAGIILAAGAAGFVATRSPTGALKPWYRAGPDYPDPMRRALSYAILAPNPHNRQPWVVALSGETEAVLTCDRDRLLPQTDPFGRQIVIGLGCFLELFSIAASAQGYRANIRVFPEGQPDDALDHRPIARLSLVPQSDAAPDPLFAHVLNRRTNRNPHDLGRPVGDGVFDRLHAVAPASVQVGATADGPLLDDLRALTRDAMLAEMATPEAHRESVDLMRIGRAEIEANPDGIFLGGAFLESLSLIGVVTRESLANPSSSAFQSGLDIIRQSAMASAGFVWISTATNDRIAQIEAGRAYMRIALEATAQGLAMQPMSQALQEYAAMAPFLRAVHEKLARSPGERVQMLARVGYADEVPCSSGS